MSVFSCASCCDYVDSDKDDFAEDTKGEMICMDCASRCEVCDQPCEEPPLCAACVPMGQKAGKP